MRRAVPLDPTLDIVFKLMLCREPELLRDMLEAILARPVRSSAILNPGIDGGLPRDKHVDLDLRTVLDDGSRADVEMQRRVRPALVRRLVFYGARGYADQLARGDDYARLTPNAVITWLAEPLRNPTLDRLHSIFELRERHTHSLFSDHLAFHLLQLPSLSSLSQPPATGYAAQVERWARFFTARDEATLGRLAAEDPIMRLATQALEALSQDPETRRRVRYRAHELKLHQIDLDASREQGLEKGLEKGRREGRRAGLAEVLLKQLRQRFGRPPAAVQACVRTATVKQLETWLGRVVTAQSLDELLAR
jgi:predicted transposase/invertase (TIGR01784 family)